MKFATLNAKDFIEGGAYGITVLALLLVWYMVYRWSKDSRENHKNMLKALDRNSEAHVETAKSMTALKTL